MGGGKERPEGTSSLLSFPPEGTKESADGHWAVGESLKGFFFFLCQLTQHDFHLLINLREKGGREALHPGPLSACT